jgi:glutamate dehydrogenase (NADP+)
MSYIDEVMNIVLKRNAGELEFHQAVKEVLDSLKAVFERHPKYQKNRILERFVEPELFERYREEGLRRGLRWIASGP